MTRDESEVLFANDAFYAAFQAGDLGAMADLWSETAPVTCIHPGHGILKGRADVIESWRRILEGGGADIRAADASAAVHGDCAVVTCFEVLEQGFLAATNVFQREGKAWKMTHHQAGPTNARPVANDPGGGAIQ